MDEVTERVFGPGPGKHPGVDRLECLVDALAEEKRPVTALFREITRLSRKPNRLTLDEYFSYRVYRDGLTAEQRQSYLGKAGAEDLFTRVNDVEYFAPARDKVVFDQLLTAEGLPVPRIRALYHPYRTLQGARTLHSPDELRDYLLSREGGDLFSKPVRERQSLAAQLWRASDGDAGTLLTADGRTVPVDDLVEAIRPFERFGYLFQERLRPHAELRRVAGSTLSTVRVAIVLDDRSPHVVRAAWKVPRDGQVADNLWREGNMLAALDTETGEAVRAVRGEGAGQETVGSHPDTDEELAGFRYPDWEEIRSLCTDAARLFPGIGFQSWDAAATDEGPVLVELNLGGDPTLIQLAHPAGLYDAEVRKLTERAPEAAEHRAWWT